MLWSISAIVSLLGYTLSSELTVWRIAPVVMQSPIFTMLPMFCRFSIKHCKPANTRVNVTCHCGWDCHPRATNLHNRRSAMGRTGVIVAGVTTNDSYCPLFPGRIQSNDMQAGSSWCHILIQNSWCKWGGKHDNEVPVWDHVASEYWRDS